MRNRLRIAWNFLHALADRARFYLRCVRESDALDACIILILCLALVGGALACAGGMTAYCVWRAGH